MKRVKLKLYSYHTFLVVPFIVLFMYGHNLGQASFDMTWRTLLLGLAGTALFFGVFYPIFRNRLKTGVYTTLFLFGIFQYGVLYEFLENLYYAGKWPLSNIHRYLLLFYGAVLFTLLLVLKRCRQDFIRVNYFLNILLFLLVVYNALLISTHNTRETAVSSQAESSSGIRFGKSAGSPDIYHIILDGYASGDVLSRYYGFDNSSFYNDLRGMGFRICDSAFANQYYTSHSLCGTLNMSLQQSGEKVNAQLSDNLVMKAMRENGYRVYYLPSGYAVTNHFAGADSMVAIGGPNEFEKSMLRHTILRLDDLVGFFARRRLESQLRNMHLVPTIAGKPKYAFLHFVAPHPPFVFDRNGHVRTRHRFAEHSWEPKSAYVEQLQFMNTQIARLIGEIVQKDPDALVVLQSDHGPWITASTAEQVFDARSHILYAYRAPARVNIPRASSPVNTYRFIFNQQFNTSLPILADSSVGKEALMKDPILLKKVAPARQLAVSR